MSLQVVSKTEFKARALELLRLVESSGRPLVITDHGRPALEVRPYAQAEALDPLRQLQGSLLRYDDPLAPIDIDWDAES